VVGTFGFDALWVTLGFTTGGFGALAIAAKLSALLASTDDAGTAWPKAEAEAWFDISLVVNKFVLQVWMYTQNVPNYVKKVLGLRLVVFVEKNTPV
jgi:hypothetical protein